MVLLDECSHSPFSLSFSLQIFSRHTCIILLSAKALPATHATYVRKLPVQSAAASSAGQPPAASG